MMLGRNGTGTKLQFNKPAAKNGKKQSFDKLSKAPIKTTQKVFVRQPGRMKLEGAAGGDAMGETSAPKVFQKRSTVKAATKQAARKVFKRVAEQTCIDDSDEFEMASTGTPAKKLPQAKPIFQRITKPEVDEEEEEEATETTWVAGDLAALSTATRGRKRPPDFDAGTPEAKASADHPDARGKRVFQRMQDHLGIGMASAASPPAVKKKRRLCTEANFAPTPTIAPQPQPMIGTCEELEKSYSRGPEAVEPHAVRPVSVLRKAFEHVRGKEVEGYTWVSDQLKSIRQDLVVQGVRDGFTWEVYSTAARLAVVHQDRDELTQCLTQLRKLVQTNCQPSQHAQHSQTDTHPHGGDEEGGDPRSPQVPERSYMEFLAYRILYTCLLQKPLELDKELRVVSKRCRKYGCIKHAMAFVNAYMTDNHCRVVKLWHASPNLGKQLISMFLPSIRKRHFMSILKAYHPTVPLPLVQKSLMLEDSELFREFLQAHGGVVSGGSIDCKASLANFEHHRRTSVNPQFADLSSP